MYLELNELKLYLIPNPKIPNSSRLGNFFFVKFMIENRNFFENCAFHNIVNFSISRFVSLKPVTSW